MNIKYVISIGICLLLAICVEAQNIKVDFPYFAGSAYSFAIAQGGERLVLEEDTIPENGKLRFVLPEEHADYRGMVQWFVTKGKNRGGLDMIMHREEYSVTCLEATPNAANIYYEGSVENETLKTYQNEQGRLFQQHDAMLATQAAYDSTSRIHKRASKEYTKILDRFNQQKNAVKQNSLYASRYLEILNFVSGVGSDLSLTGDQEKAEDLVRQFAHNIDFHALYTSGLWTLAIKKWIETHISILQKDEPMRKQIVFVLQKLDSKELYTSLLQEATTVLSRYGKDAVVASLVPSVKEDNMLLHFKGSLLVYKADLSGRTPDILFSKVDKNGEIQSQTLATDNMDSQYTLLFFYQSGCGPCERAIASLIVNYNVFQREDVRILSVSADEDVSSFLNTAADFPWEDQSCDLLGFDGQNFTNYGVIGTPTLFLLDSKGTVLESPATVEACLEWLSVH